MVKKLLLKKSSPPRYTRNTFDSQMVAPAFHVHTPSVFSRSFLITDTTTPAAIKYG